MWRMAGTCCRPAHERCAPMGPKSIVYSTIVLYLLLQMRQARPSSSRIRGVQDHQTQDSSSRSSSKASLRRASCWMLVLDLGGTPCLPACWAVGEQPGLQDTFVQQEVSRRLIATASLLTSYRSIPRGSLVPRVTRQQGRSKQSSLSQASTWHMQ
jgi:hypothetical protein